MKLKLLCCSDGECYEKWEVNEEGGNFYRLYHIKGGEAWCDIDGNTINLKIGHLYLFPINKPYSIHHNPDKPLDHLWFHFNAFPIMLNNLTDITFEKNYSIKSVLMTLRTLVCMQIDQQLIECQLDLFFKLLTNQNIFSPVINTDLQRLIDYINENYTKSITIADLSKISGYNSNYLIKYFYLKTGTTPHKYIVNLKMQRSCELLISGMAVNRVSEAVGYSDTKAFSKAFSKHTNIHPSKYKKVIKGD